jgi:hypothetical protein
MKKHVTRKVFIYKMSAPKKQAVSLTILLLFLLISNSVIYGEWISASPPHVSSEWRLNSVHFTSADTGWAVGSVGSHWRTNYSGILLNYSGTEWNPIHTPALGSDTWELNSVHFTSEKEGWAVGWALETDWFNEKGVLLHYSRGEWKAVSSPFVSNEWWLNSVHFTSSHEGWAVGSVGSTWSSLYSGCLLHYSRGKWSSVSPPYVSSEWRLNNVHFTSADEGWAVGSDWTNKRGVLLHYSGGIWRSVYPPSVSTDWELNSVHFTSADTGWAVGSDQANKRGVLLQYSQGGWSAINTKSGISWQSPAPADWELNSVYFTSPNEGWAVGSDLFHERGVMLFYSNDGWTSVSFPSVSTQWRLNDVYFNSADEGWVVGTDWFHERGVMLHFISSSSIPLLPDLTGNWLAMKEKCKRTQKEIRCKIKGLFAIHNIGNEDADSSYVRFYLSDDNTYDMGDTFLKQVSTGMRMKAGKIKKKKLKLKMPNDVSATSKYIIAVIDADNSIAESNESNNTIAYGPLSGHGMHPSSTQP